MIVVNFFGGYGEQVSQTSWWPSDLVWASSGLNVGYWSSSCEEWFQRCLDALNDDALNDSSWMVSNIT